MTDREKCFWTVTARIRQRDAIGTPWDRAFTVDCPTDATREEVVGRWFELYSLQWELFHVVSYVREGK